MDFVHDQLATGKKIRVLTVIDTFSRSVPVLHPRFSYWAEDVVRALERVCPKMGYPKTIRVDQGSEFVSRDLEPRSPLQTFPPSERAWRKVSQLCVGKPCWITAPQRISTLIPL